MSRMIGVVLSGLMLVLISSVLDADESSPAYGAYPHNYQELITAWLNKAMIDPSGLQVRWKSEPRPGELSVGKDKRVSGFLVDFATNSRNIFGVYTGFQKHTALIRDGQVVTATGFVGR